jgi:transposase
MMGRKAPSSKQFYRFSLEERVPPDHLLRRIAVAVDFAFVRRLTERFYSHTGQPGIDPEVLFKMALVGYLYGIASERRLAEEIRLNLAYMWFLGYDLDETPPDHSVLSKARRRFGPTVYQAFFTEIVRQCERAGLVRGDKVYLDSTLVEADACLDSVGSRALLAQLPEVGAHVARLWRENPDPPVGDGPPTDPPPAPASMELAPAAAAAEAHPPAGPGGWAAPVRTASTGPGPRRATGADPPNKVVGRVNGWVVSRTDPEAELVSRARVPLDLYYKVHVGVDAGRARIVTAVEVTGGAVADEYLLDRLTREHAGTTGRTVGEVVADTKYGTAANDAALEARGIAASIPMHENGATRRALPADAFAYDAATDSYLCPGDQRLRRQGTSTTGGANGGVIDRARPSACAACAHKAVCCGTAQARTMFRPDDGGLRDRTVAYLRTFRARQSIRRRKAWVETVFGDGKERRGLRRARFRGRDGVRVQALLIATAHNVRKLALRTTTRPGTGLGTAETQTWADRIRPLSVRHPPATAADPRRTGFRPGCN